MSFKLVHYASELDFKNEPLIKFVLLSLCNFANADDEAWPSYPTLAKFCSISESTAIRHIKTLEERGYITKVSRVHKNGRDTSNLYKINLVGVSPCQGEGVTVLPHRVSPCYPSKENSNNEQSLEQNICEVAPQTSPSCTENVILVFDHWKKTMSKTKSKLDQKRINRIKSALKDYSIEDLKSAIEGCARTEYNMGKNKDGKLYDDIELILRDSSHIERFISNNVNKITPTVNHKSSNMLEGMRRAQDRIKNLSGGNHDVKFIG